MHNRPQAKGEFFFDSLKRLISELKPYKVVITVALIFAAISSVLSIIAPNQLSKLTDEITLGLVVKTDNIEKLSNEVNKNMQNMNLNKVMALDISMDEKSKFMYSITTLNKEDYASLINLLNNTNEVIINEILPSIIIDDVTINGKDQLSYLNIMTSLKDINDEKEVYSKIDELPSNIGSVIKPSMNMTVIINIAIFLASIYVISALLTYFESLIMALVSNKFAKKLRTDISKKINRLPLRYFDNNQIGDILSRITNDVDTIAQSMNQSLATLVSAITLFLGTLFMMFKTNYIMALTAIISSIIGFIFMFIILGKSQKYFNARQKELGKLNSHIEEVYSSLLVIKAYNGKEESDKKFDELNKKVYEANKYSQFLGGLMPAMMGFIGNLGYVSVCIVGALLVSNDVITFGVIVAFMTYVRLFTNPLNQIAQSFTSLQITSAASKRVFEFLDEEEMERVNVKQKLDKRKVKGDIEFRHVKFAYDKKPIIKDFTAKIKHGQKIAIVGPTGAGKTTMVNLLMRFYDIKDGDILIDNVSIKDLSRENIHDLFTMVLQDTWLFNGTIKENIVYNQYHISDKRVREVCDSVGLTHFIDTLPNTFDYVLEENDSISSGQKQLLTIARSMLEDAPFLILDEATSNVDTRTEELVTKAMDKLMKNKTSFIIAHRLSTIKNADLILVMKDGNIIEQGNHEYLLNKGGFYAKLYNSQFQK